MMKTKHQVSFLLLIIFCSISLCFNTHGMTGYCLGHQQFLLLQLKNSLTFDPESSTKLVQWNQTADCCQWNGVTCSEGLVTGLDLSFESITGRINDSSSLFSLQHLQSLNLASNSIHTTIPSGLQKLTNLRHLNLSEAGFAGQIPIEISQLTRLVTLDLSASFEGESSLKLEDPNLAMLIRNLTQITELYLDGVNISSQRYEWSRAISSSLPSLRVLSLSTCSLSGPIDSSIFQLKQLSVLYLSLNYDLYGTLPDFPQNASLQTLSLSYTNFYGQLPDSMSNLRQLSWLDLSYCQFNGTISSKLSNLTQLVLLDLLGNNFTGPIPSFFMSKKLVYLHLSHNSLTDPIPSTHFEGLVNLVFIDLSHNLFRGKIPSSIFMLPSVNYLELSNNNFSGEIDLGMIQKLTNLTILYLSYNNLSIIDTTNRDSTFPSFLELGLASCSLTKFPQLLRNQSILYILDLSINHIHGSIPHWIWSSNISYLNLSHNYLTDWEESFENNSNILVLDLHSNNLQGPLPVLPQNAPYLDFSNNNLSSVIPPDIGNFLFSTLFLSFSSNKFHGSIPQSICNAPDLQVLDLSNNSLSGIIPKCLIAMNGSLVVLDLRRNKLSGSIDTFPGSCDLRTLDLNGNFLQGKLPKHLVNCRMLEVLDLGNNQINDKFPCWLKSVSTLRVLILRSNILQGSLKCPGTLASSWPHLQIFDIASNKFSGRIPPPFFNNWKAMMADHSDIDHIQFPVTPYGIQTYYQDQVTVTSKHLQMELVKILTIFTSVDLSCNNFEGPIPAEVGQLKTLYILNLSQNAFIDQIPSSLGNLTLLESLDLSRNKLIGVIPAQLASLTFLSYLNLSYNQLVGKIPTSTQLQSFPMSSFQGNAGLCGPPLTENCSDIRATYEKNSDSGSSIDWNLLSAELGFVFGFGSIIWPLLLWKRWRLWYSNLLDGILGRIFPQLYLGNRN